MTLPDGYITGQDRTLLEVFYTACLSEGGTADEVTLRGLKAVISHSFRAAAECKEFKPVAVEVVEDKTPIKIQVSDLNFKIAMIERSVKINAYKKLLELANNP
jgi:hypothetical protein